MIVAGAVFMAGGQLLMATAGSLPLGLAARVLVGAGDAMTFISVLRLIPAWFPARRAPLVTQLTGLLGQAGHIVAAFPLVAGLHAAGWTPTFVTAAAVGLVAAVAVAVGLRNAPPGMTMVAATGRLDALRASWREPGTRLGLATHFVTAFSGNLFALFWGYPYLVEAQGLSPAAAGGLLTLLVVAGMGIGPLLGALAGRWPLRRSVLVLGVVLSSAVAWGVVLLWPGRAPVWLLAVLVLVLAGNGPGSILGFDFARRPDSAARPGSSTWADSSRRCS
jgi:cyanate permease